VSETKLIVGCGYLGRRVARQWIHAGHTVVGVVRHAEHAEQLRQLGIRPMLADVTRPATLADLPPAETILYCVGLDPQSDSSRRALYVDGLRNVLQTAQESTRRIIYTSSTGVYGQTDSGWVDEDSPCGPTRDAGRVFLEAEQLLADHVVGPRSIILRLAGLYGPGRLPRKADVRAGKPIVAPQRGYLNLIHVDDAASVVLAVETRATPPRTYCAADGHPVERRAYFGGLAKRLGAVPPRFVEPPGEAPAAIRAAADKRVSNGRMMAELGVALQYPSIDDFWKNAPDEDFH